MTFWNRLVRYPPPTAKKKRAKVDVGKVMALHNAGWSNVKIADEMGLHPVTVGKYVKQEVTVDGNRQD